MRRGDWLTAQSILSLEPETSAFYGAAMGNLAQTYLAMDRLAEAWTASTVALDAITSRSEQSVSPPSFIQFARNKAEILIGNGQPAAAIGVIKHACDAADDFMAEEPQLSHDLLIQKAHAIAVRAQAHVHLGQYEDAIVQFRSAREIYRSISNHTEGVAELLTNYALPLVETGQTATARFALDEAEQIATNSNNATQLQRIANRRAMIFPDADRLDEHFQLLERSAAEAESNCEYQVAWLRRAAAARQAAQFGDASAGLSAVRKAYEMESRVRGGVQNSGGLRFYHAVLLRAAGASSDEILGVLIEGSRLLVDRVSHPLRSADLQHITSVMHDHFRMTAQLLRSMGRIEESFVAFESGRALAHAIAADDTCREKLGASNPFKARGTAISVSLDVLQTAQSSLTDNVIIAPVTMAGELVAYIVSKDRVECVSVPLEVDIPAEASQFEHDASMVPLELQKGRGSDAISKSIHFLASEIGKLVGGRRIASCMPHAFLHQIPWRAIFRAAGLRWDQLSFATEFGLIVRQITVQSAPFPLRCSAIGFNSEETQPGVDTFAVEAKSFATAFGKDGRFLDPCTKGSLELALLSPGLSFVSCHASTRDRAGAAAVWLKLSDGDVSLEDVLPKSLSKIAILLSACETGVFRVADGDYPIGAIPELLRRGAAFVVGTRYTIRIPFAAFFFPRFAAELASRSAPADAFAKALNAAEAAGYNLWRDLASVEMYRHQQTFFQPPIASRT